MKLSSLIRLSGLSLFLGGLLDIAGTVLEPHGGGLEYATNPLAVSSGLLEIAAVLLVMLGLPGLFAAQADRAGILGFIGTVTVFFCLPLLDLTHGYVDAAIRPALAATPEAARLLGPGGSFDKALAHGLAGSFISLAGPVSLLGLILLGIATMRAGVLPRWTGVLLVAAAVLAPLGFIVPVLDGISLASPYAALGCAGLALTVAKRAPSTDGATFGPAGPESGARGSVAPRRG
jgi:hypothetical protein